MTYAVPLFKRFQLYLVC